MKTAKIQGGYYIKARCIQDSEIASAPPHVREIWDWLLKECNHSDRKSSGRIIKRGQCVRTYNDIREGLKWKKGWCIMRYSKDDCETAMKMLRKHTRITTEKTTRGLVITIINYEFYQNPQNYENHKRTTRITTDSPHYKQECKEEKNKDSKALESPHLINQSFEEAWDGWLEMRTKIKAPNTHRALQLTLKELNKYKVEIAIAMVEQSTMRGWRGVFPLKNGTVKKHYPWNDLK